MMTHQEPHLMCHHQASYDDTSNELLDVSSNVLIKRDLHALACLLEHGQDSFTTETAPDGLSGRSLPIPDDPVDCLHGRAVERLSVLFGTQVLLLTNPPEPVGCSHERDIKPSFTLPLHV